MLKKWVTNIGKMLWLSLGHFFLVLGIVGIFLPLLPTTPFLLLAAISYGRGSVRFEQWLKNHPTLGPPVTKWRQHGVISLRAKSMATVMIAFSLAYVGFRPDIPVFGKGAMAITLAGVLFFLWSRPSQVKVSPAELLEKKPTPEN
jgi:uncharacterized membrane protein YbaN (DUF454 family)